MKNKPVPLNVAEAKERFRPVHWSELSVVVECDYFAKGLIEPGGHLLIYGASASGKTFLGMDLAFAIASGLGPWFGIKVRKSFVLYICSEGGKASAAKRVAALQEKYGVKPSDCDLHIISVAPNFGIQHSTDARTIRDHIAGISAGPWVVVNDTLAKSMQGQSEDTAEGMGAYLQNVRGFCEDGHGFVSVHHTGKVAERGARGSYSLPADVDGMVMVEKRGRISVGTIQKARDGESGAELPFALDQVSLGNDSEGDALTTCVIREVEDAPAKKSSLSHKQEQAMQWLNDLLARDCGKPHSYPGKIPNGAMVVPLQMWRDTLRSRNLLAASNPSVTWNRLLTDLMAAGAIGTYEEVVWVVRSNEQPEP